MLVDIINSNNFIDYDKAVDFMQNKVTAIIEGHNNSAIWLLEHPALYTAGSSARDQDLLDKRGLSVYKSGRGGQYTYHGPGQRVVYLMLDIKKLYNKPDIRRFIYDIEEWVINTLHNININALRRKGRVGIWTIDNGEEKKIAAIGIRVKKWVSLHGIAINLSTDLANFTGIVPCGLKDYGVTNVHKHNKNIDMRYMDSLIIKNFFGIFSCNKGLVYAI